MPSDPNVAYFPSTETRLYISDFSNFFSELNEIINDSIRNAVADYNTALGLDSTYEAPRIALKRLRK
jgi:hypothetical protein